MAVGAALAAARSHLGQMPTQRKRPGCPGTHPDYCPAVPRCDGRNLQVQGGAGAALQKPLPMLFFAGVSFHIAYEKKCRKAYYFKIVQRLLPDGKTPVYIQIARPWFPLSGGFLTILRDGSKKALAFLLSRTSAHTGERPRRPMRLPSTGRFLTSVRTGSK